VPEYILHTKLYDVSEVASTPVRRRLVSVRYPGFETEQKYQNTYIQNKMVLFRLNTTVAIISSLVWLHVSVFSRPSSAQCFPVEGTIGTGKCWPEGGLKKTETCSHIRVLMIVC
jgi:hypothetical protein